jgi:VWFA-related protein
MGMAAALGAQGERVPVAPLPGVFQPQSPDTTPVFRSGTTVVPIDVFVTDADGHPVAGLTAEDFEVREAGRVRSISTFSEVDIAIDAPVGLPEADAAEPDVATNVRPPGRTFVFALDEVAPDRALRARHLLRQFIDEHLGPHDMAAVALTGRGLADSGQDFTSNRRLLLEAIDKFSGGFPPDPPPCPWSSNARELAASLRRLMEFMATIPGRKILVYVGEKLGGLDFYALQTYRGGVLTIPDTDAHAALAAATRGNVTVYPLDPCGLDPGVGGIGALEHRMDLRMLAQATGGFAITNTNNFTDAFTRLIQENSHYYTIGFDSGYTRRDGRFVPVDVRVKREGLQVRSRGGYVAPLGNERRPERVTGDARMATVSDALASAVPVSGIPMRVFAAPYRAGRNVNVAVAIEIDIATVPLAERKGVLSAPMEVSYLATDDRGKVHRGRRHATTLTIQPSAADRIRRDGVRLLSEFTLPPGRYQLRMAAGTAAIAGSAIHDLEVPDFAKEALAMSGLFLTSDHAAAVTTLAPIQPLGGALPGPPTARRDFTREETMHLFTEVYANVTRNAPPHTIVIAASLRDEGGETIPLATARHPSEASGTYRFTAQAPLAALPAGRYVLEVEARSDLGDGAVTVRRVPFRVR